LKRYQSRTGKRDLNRILSSYYFQVAKLSSTIDKWEKEVEKMQRVERIATNNLFQSEHTVTDSKKFDNYPKLTFGSDAELQHQDW